MKTYYVSAYRAAGRTDDEAIRLCFAEAKKEPERVIVFDGPGYLISRSVLIPSDTTVILDGCTVKQADETYDTAFRGDNLQIDPQDPAGLPLSVSPLQNIRLLGKNGAVICGPDRNGRGFHPGMKQTQELTGDFWGWRTLTVSFSRCTGLEISGIRFRQPRCWCISLDLCQNGHLHDLRIDSNVKNGDGIDLRSGCHHILIENVSGVTSDDNIACTALFDNEKKPVYPGEKYIYPMEPTRNSGPRSPWDRDISDVTVRHCVTGGMHHGIICLCANGCQVYDIHIEDIDERDPGPWENPYHQATVKLYTGYGSGYTPGDLHDIHVKNVVNRFSAYPVYCNAEVRNVVLENIVSEAGKTNLIDFPEGMIIR